jgi:signal peptidase II
MAGGAANQSGMTRRLALWGRLSSVGLAFAVLTFAFDQAHKAFMLHAFRIAERQPVSVMPFFDLVLVWNRGVSYGWFAQHTAVGRFGLVVLALAASLALWIWLARTGRPLTAAALGLIIGGALGNAVDRVIYGAVADFFLLHWHGFDWYVFNIADLAIVAGVGLLLYESWSEDARRRV